MANVGLEEALKYAVKGQLDLHIKKIIDEEIEETVKRVRERIAIVAASIAIDTEHFVRLETDGRDVRITIKGDFGKAKG